jgi:myo-inositol-1(or 4)-monophosphatase
VNRAVAVLRDELLELACSLARDAGRLVRDGRHRGISDIATKSSATDVVTEFDKASERYLVEGILQVRPHDGIVGEEGTDTDGTSGVRWLIDPIDGTTNFLYGLAGYAVSVAAADARGALAGAVYLPATDELFAAGRGCGATCNGAPIAPSGNRLLAGALVGTGFSYLPERREAQATRIAGIIGRVRDIRRFGAAAADLCYVAAGRLDVYFEEYLSPWDVAAGELIARESGCRVGDFDGGPMRPAQLLAASPDLFDPMIELLAGAPRRH